MKTIQIRPLLIVLSLTVLAGVVASCQFLLNRHSNNLAPRHYGEITLMIADKQEPGYSSGFRLGPRRNVGMATLSRGQQFKFVCEFIRMTDQADVYTLDLSLPTGTNIAKTIMFEGETQLIYETGLERIEMRQSTVP